MKHLLVVIYCLSVLGCVTPRTLTPVAVQNRENVKNYVQNNERIYPIVEKLIALRLDIKLAEIRVQVKNDIRKGYPGDELKSKTQNIQEVLQTIDSLSNKTDEISQLQLDSKKKELEALKLKHPAAYDVATGKIEEKTVITDKGQINDIFSKYDNKAAKEITYPILDKYTVVAEFMKTRQAIIDAYESYVNKLKEQGRIAIRYAEAMVFYAEKKYDAGEVILQTIGDVEIQQDILGIIQDTSGEERSAKAKEILEAISLSK